MKRGVFLSTCWAVLAILILSNLGRGVDPDCEKCDCSEAEAWLEVYYEGNPPVQKSYGPVVLRAWDEKDPDKFGAALKDAKWTIDLPEKQRKVYATPCMKDNSQKETGAFKRLIYTDDWPRACKLTATQSGSFYQPVKHDLTSTKYSVHPTTGDRFSCGAQVKEEEPPGGGG